MTQAETPAQQGIEDAREKAAELGWEDGLVELAVGKGFSLQEVWQALSAKIDGATARQFLSGEGQ